MCPWNTDALVGRRIDRHNFTNTLTLKEWTDRQTDGRTEGHNLKLTQFFKQ